MPKPLSSDSEGEDAKDSDDSSPVAANQGVPDYERQRLLRIAENMKRMEALGLHKMAKSLNKGSTWRSTANGKKDKGKKRRKINEDEDYNPYSGEDAEVSDDSSPVAANGKKHEGRRKKINEEDEDSNSEKGKITSNKKKKKNGGKKLQVDPDFVCDDELIQGKTAHLRRTRRSLRQRNK